MIGIVNYACDPRIQILNHPCVYVFLLEVDPVDWSESVGMSRLKFGSTLKFEYFDFSRLFFNFEIKFRFFSIFEFFSIFSMKNLSANEKFTNKKINFIQNNLMSYLPSAVRTLNQSIVHMHTTIHIKTGPNALTLWSRAQLIQTIQFGQKMCFQFI